MTMIRELRTHAEPTVTVEELADYWRVKPRVLYRDITKGALRARKIGRAFRITIDDARAYGKPADELAVAPIGAVR